VSRVLGIDPGKQGALAVLDGGELTFVDDMPVVDNRVSGALLADLIDEVFHYHPDDRIAVVESVHSMPKQGVASSFDFGKSYGMVLGVLAHARIRVVHVPSNQWKKAMRLSPDKEQSRLRALERWPEHTAVFKRKKDADRAEAALIALWWIETQAKPKEKP
jgi:crossover junction endodeoxyribonuclease RuvC